MNRTDLDDTTRTALTSLDPAPTSALDPAAQARADAVLARILETPEPDGAEPTLAPAPARRRRTGRRLALGAAAAAALATVVVGAQLVGGGDSAYATWTATPHTPTTPEQAAATDDCRDSLVDSLSAGPDGDPTGVTERTIRRAGAVLSEQRGVWTLVVLADADGFDATCITEDGPGFGGNAFGSMGYGPTELPGPRDVLVTSGGTGGSENGSTSVLIGSAGPQVAAIVVHTQGHGDVTATVTNGRFAAWWPGPRITSETEESLDTTPPATVTYTDGTSEERRLGVGLNAS